MKPAQGTEWPSPVMFHIYCISCLNLDSVSPIVYRSTIQQHLNKRWVVEAGRSIYKMLRGLDRVDSQNVCSLGGHESAIVRWEGQSLKEMRV